MFIYEILLMDTNITSWNKEEGHSEKFYLPSPYSPGIIILQ